MVILEVNTWTDIQRVCFSEPPVPIKRSQGSWGRGSATRGRAMVKLAKMLEVFMIAKDLE